MFQHEIKLWRRGYIVVGVDEVGRGAFAGPIVAAACAFDPSIRQLADKMRSKDIIINDSKLLTQKQREQASLWIKNHCIVHSVSAVDVRMINKIGIVKANIVAMRKAVVQLINQLNETASFFVLSDYFHIPRLRGVGRNRQKNLVHGDKLSFSIAAASIIAKVERDRLMRDLSKKHNKYKWHLNKGYGTEHHRKTLQMYGKTELHRDTFVQNYI